MAKMTIAWHEQCLHNQKRGLEEDRQRALQAIRQYRRNRKNVQAYGAQINAAKAKRMDGFDADRFGKNKPKT